MTADLSENSYPSNTSHDLSKFTTKGNPKGASPFKQISWHLVSAFIFQMPLMIPSRFKALLLRCFGGKIGLRLVIRPRVNILRPWNLRIGDHVWIGDGCQLLNLELITIESNTALAHEVYLAAGSHDVRSRTFAYKNRPITIKSGCWIATRAFIGPGVTVGENSIVAAGSIVIRDVPPSATVAGNPARIIGPRFIDRE